MNALPKVEQNLIGMAARQTDLIRQFLATVKPESPVSISDVVTRMGDRIKNEVQVRDDIKGLHRKGKLSRIREGRGYKYWSRTYAFSAPAPVANDNAPVAAAIPSPNPSLVPEIRVEADRVVIEHARCRIVVELKG